MGDQTRKHIGTCHCGAVRFAVEVAEGATIGRCNCTMCRRSGQTGTIVKPAAFQLLAGAGNLTEYQHGARISKLFFCKTCGVHCFASGHMEQLGGDYVSANLNCVDDFDAEASVVYWDGRHNNWQAGARKTPWPLAPSA